MDEDIYADAPVKPDAFLSKPYQVQQIRGRHPETGRQLNWPMTCAFARPNGSNKHQPDQDYEKEKKILLFAGLGLLVLLIAAVIVVGFFLGDIVKKGAETVGPQITKTTITLDAVDLSLLTGSAKVKGLVVGNPDGYKTPQAISVGTAAVGVNPMSVLSDKIVIRSVVVEAPEITFEGNPLSKNNLGEILDNVNAVAKSGGPAPATNATATAASKPGKKLEVDDFVITNAKVHASLTGMGGKELTLTLPPIHFTNLGTGPDGITATELTQRVLSEITTATIKAVASQRNESRAATPAKPRAKAWTNIKKGLGGLLGK